MRQLVSGGVWGAIRFLRGLKFAGASWAWVACWVICGVVAGHVSVEAGEISISLNGTGLMEEVPLTLGKQADHHVTGESSLWGKYTGDGRLRFDELLNAAAGKFSSSLPFVVTAENGDQICFHYQGTVEILDAGNGLMTTRWVAEFKPIIGSGTGALEPIHGGSFRLTTETDSFSPTAAINVGYRWSGAGVLTMVPEPSLALSSCLGGLVLMGFRRRRRPMLVDC